MLSEQDKQAILNGAWARTDTGNKIKLIGIFDGDYGFTHLFASESKEQSGKYNDYYWGDEASLIAGTDLGNIIGLWEKSNEPEPFNLERALNGEPINYGGRKCFVCKNPLPECSKNYIVSGENSLFRTSLDFLQICKMWKEPQPELKIVTLTLPCPLKEPQENMWLIDNNFDLVKPHPINIKREEPKTMELIQKCLNNGRAFATDEDAQAWLDALRDNRR